MKTFSIVVLAMCIFCAVGAFGQGVNGTVVNAEILGFQMPEHPQMASRQAMGREVDLLEESQSISAQGEMPLWEAMEMMPPKPVTPLGDVARAVRQEHALAPKATIIWNN